MINCDDFLHILSDYLDGEISDSRTRAINTHLSTCRSCQSVLKRTSSVVGFVRQLPKVKASDAFQERLENSIRKEVELSSASGIDRLSQSIGSVPLKPVFATLTAAAAIAAMTIVAGDKYLNEDSPVQPLVTPRLSTPPLPGTSNTATIPLQKSMLRQANDRDASIVVDSIKVTNPLRDRQNSNRQDILRTLSTQSQAVRNVKDKEENQK